MGARVGSFNTTDAWLLHGATLGAFDVVTHLRWGASDGHDGTITSDAQTALDQLQGTSASLAPGSVNTGYQALDASIDARLDDLRMSLSYRLRDKLQSGAGAASAIDPLGRGRTERWLADLNWRRITLSPDDGNFLEGDGDAPGALVYFFGGVPKARLMDVRNFLIDDFGFADACVDDGGTNKKRVSR